jgi:ATP-dependent DNA helicase RecG
MQSNYKNILETPIEYLPSVGPLKATLLKNELNIYQFQDLLFHFPFRYIDKTHFHRINEIVLDSTEPVQLKGILRRLETIGEGKAKRASAILRDETGSIELVWFKSIHWAQTTLVIGGEYIVYGRLNWYNSKATIAHPEIEPVKPTVDNDASGLKPQQHLDAVYNSTEKLNARGLDTKAQRKLVRTLMEKLIANSSNGETLRENLPDYLVQKFKLYGRKLSLQKIHFPTNQIEIDESRKRLKFEELFFLQLKLLQLKRRRQESVRGYAFDKVGSNFNDFYSKHLPFELTGAQKRVVKEIRRDLGNGIQMNRLVQGDVGSGKTIVALLCMLIALDNGFQSLMMAPTEILGQQHFTSLSKLCEGIGVQVAFLSGSVKGKKRDEILKRLAAGEIDILIGTHALIEDWVVFKNLGLSIIDEQHRFGVEQRAKLWRKSTPFPPHVLVMTATPIPRTLAMTLYGDLDVSVIDELPPGRKDIKTEHRTDNHRLRVIGFMKEQIALGRQIYVVYPLIEENEKLDLLALTQGYENLCLEFKQPEYQISILHGKMKPADKDFEMQRFVSGQTQIMVATTVIEVGVNVPNASVMIIEHTERFGLSQLHQLRGRVGRGAEQSYCILMSSFKVSAVSRERIQTMCRTNNGFDIAEADLRLRGPGDIQGTQQSGALNLHIADLAKDQRILAVARETAIEILTKDPLLQLPEHESTKLFLGEQLREDKVWARIS